MLLQLKTYSAINLYVLGRFVAQDLKNMTNYGNISIFFLNLPK